MARFFPRGQRQVMWILPGLPPQPVEGSGEPMVFYDDNEAQTISTALALPTQGDPIRVIVPGEEPIETLVESVTPTADGFTATIVPAHASDEEWEALGRELGA